MCVFDSSAYINGQRYHYKPATFPSVWEQIGAAIEAGRILLPREVYREVTKKDDEIAKWIARYEQLQTAPSREVQEEVGAIAAAFPKPGVRNSADPFIIAEARVRGLTVAPMAEYQPNLGVADCVGEDAGRWTEYSCQR